MFEKGVIMLNVSSPICQSPSSPPRTSRKRKLEDFFNVSVVNRKIDIPTSPQSLHTRLSTGGSARKNYLNRSDVTPASPEDIRRCLSYRSPSVSDNFSHDAESRSGEHNVVTIMGEYPKNMEAATPMEQFGAQTVFPLKEVLNDDPQMIEQAENEENNHASFKLDPRMDSKSGPSTSGLKSDGSFKNMDDDENYSKMDETSSSTQGNGDFGEDDTECDEEYDELESVRRRFCRKQKLKAKVAVTQQELYTEEYEVRRVMKRTVDANGDEAFIVYWKNYNYTFCTLQARADLEGCLEELKFLEEKEKGLDAIMLNIVNNSHRYDRPVDMIFTRFEIPDALPLGQVNIPDETFHRIANVSKHGYWRIKQLEVKWNDIIRNYYDKRKRKVAPLYIEGWHVSAYSSLPKFKFIVGGSTWSSEAKRLRYRAESEACGCCPCHDPCENCQKRFKEELALFCPISNGLLQIPPPTQRECYYWTYECDGYKRCTCTKCEYRLLSRGRKVALVVFFEFNKGWTVRAVQDIRKGQFIAEYLGEVVTSKEANRRDTSYQFEIGKFWYVDALPHGNESRFFSHSCKPNALVVRVYGLNQVIHKVGVFALKDIKMGEEITFDYHPDYVDGEPHRGAGSCLCKETTCRGWL